MSASRLLRLGPLAASAVRVALSVDTVRWYDRHAAIYLVLALVVTAVVFMVKRPRWLGSLEPPPRPAGKQADPDWVEQPPRPVSEMTGQELADWAQGDPEKLRRLLRQRRY